MRKITSICLLALSCISTVVLAQTTTDTNGTTTTTDTTSTMGTTTSTTDTTTATKWHGEFFNIVPRRADVTVDWCKAHVLNSYETSANMVDKEVTGDNGIKATNIKHNMREQGGIFLITGTALFKGTFDGKEWSDTVRYYGETLERKDATQQGAWYTKDCKGFYKVGPV